MSNCIIYALRMLWRDGGYVMLRKSRFGWWPHLLHMSITGEITQFVPCGRKRKRTVPPLFFKGYIKTGDHE